MDAAQTDRPRPIRFWSERILGAGEDACPIALRAAGSWLAVFDGMGGSGGFAPNSSSNPSARTHARLASESVQSTTDRYAQERSGITSEGDVEELGARILQALDDLDLSLGRARAKLKSRMVQVLPTTMALAWIAPEADTHRRLALVWAGDSRVYLLRPAEGLQQISQDDLSSDCDALEALLTEPRMSNFVSLASTFRLNYGVLELEEPFLVMTATDGCFDYFRTPMHFESALLAAITSTSRPNDFTQRFGRAIGRVTGDDASFALAGCGFASWKHVASAFRSREALVRDRYIVPVDHSADGLPTVAIRDRIWEDYRSQYELFRSHQFVEVLITSPGEESKPMEADEPPGSVEIPVLPGGGGELGPTGAEPEQPSQAEVEA